VAGAEIVERDAAARVTQRVDKARRLFEIVECRGFGDFNEAARQIGSVP